MWQLHFTVPSRNSIPGGKPRLVRQSAVHEECSIDLSTSPPRLGVRFLPTIPSAADSSIILDDEPSNCSDSGNGQDNNDTINDSEGPIIITTHADEDSNLNNNNNVNGVNSEAGQLSNGRSLTKVADDCQPFYAVLHSGNTMTTLSSPKDNKRPPWICTNEGRQRWV